LGIASAAYVDPRTCGGVRNYTSQGDIVHKLDTYGARKFAKHHH